MVIENPLPPFSTWITGGILTWLFGVGGLGLAALAIGFVAAAVQHGPEKAGDLIYRMVAASVADLVAMSPRRILALANLAVKESLRLRALAGLIVFLVILAFASWFLETDSAQPARLYLSFMLTATTYLVLLLAIFLSAFSLPNDIQNRTIFTLVTKPVRSSEIVLGRALGFTAIGTVLLVLMGLMSYVFVHRMVDHTHEIVAEDLTPAGGRSAEGQLVGQTPLSSYHRHEVTIDPDGNGQTDLNFGHWHEITSETGGGETRYVVGPPVGQFNARVPVYGTLRFTDRQGQETDKGINVGTEWAYRSYIDGGTQASAIWSFEGLRAADFPDGLPFELTLSIYRSYKGTIEQGVLGSIVLQNPSTGRRSAPRNFVGREYTIDRQDFPRQLQDSEGNPIDLFDDLVDSNGKLEVELSCLEPGQYYGMARPDLYILARQGTFWLNFIKGYVGIWLQMVLITFFGVMWSTFLNGAVAMLATLGTLIGGMLVDFMAKLAAGEMIGGGPVEAALRIGRQDPISTQLEPGLLTDVVTGIDAVLRQPLGIVATLLPDFKQYNLIRYVADGFDVPFGVLSIHIVSALGYAVPVFLIGFVVFKSREVAK